MSLPPLTPCPGADELELAITAAAGPGADAAKPTAPDATVVEALLPGPMQAHLDQCSACRKLARTITENLAFMAGVASVLASGPRSRPGLSLRGEGSDGGGWPHAELLPGYRLVREISRGGQGVVYEGLQIETKRRVAIKVIEPVAPSSVGVSMGSGHSNSRAQRRIEREAELASGLRHPNIVTIYHCAPVADGRYALAMEYISGTTLDLWAAAKDTAVTDDANADTKPDPKAAKEAVRTKLRVMATVCEAVQHAHNNGVIHRDLKPGNVLVDAGDVPRVVDFGIARRVVDVANITIAGSFAGTLAYASPEQVSGESGQVDTRSDVYSLGVMLYELLAGERPYDTSGSLSGAINNITTVHAPQLATIAPLGTPASAELRAIVTMALAKDKTERYQSAAALGSDITCYLEGRAVVARQQSTLYVLRKLAAKHRYAFAGVAGLGILLTTFAGYMAWSSNRLAQQRELLAASLSSSTIQRGRLMGSNGENARAETLIWPELMASGVKPDASNLLYAQSPQARQAAWALAELYSRHPTLMHAPVNQGSGGLRFEGDTEIRIVNHLGATQQLSIPSAALLRSTPALTVKSSDKISATADIQRAGLMLDPNGKLGVIEIDGVATVIDLDTAAHYPLSARWPTLIDAREVSGLSPDGTRVLCFGPQRGISLLHTGSRDPIASVGIDLPLQAQVHFSRDGRLFGAGIQDKAYLWSTDDGRVMHSVPIPELVWTSAGYGLITTVKLSPDGHTLVVGIHNVLLIYDLAQPEKPPRQLAAHRGFLNGVGFSQDGAVLWSSGSERNIKAWNTATWEQLNTFESSTPTRGHPTISDDGSLIGVCDHADTVRVFETRPRQWFKRLDTATKSVQSVRFDAGGNRLAAVAADGTVRVWRADGSTVWAWPPSDTSYGALTFTPDGKALMVARQDGAILSVDADTGVRFGPELQGPARATQLRVSPDNSILLSFGTLPDINVFHLDGSRPPHTFTAHTGRSISAIFSRDSQTLYTVGHDGVCAAWNAATFERKASTTAVGSPVRAVTLSPDGSVVAIGADDWKIRLYDAQTLQLIKTIEGAKQHVFGLAYHPSGKIIFSCCRDSVVQVWDVESGSELAELEGHSDLVLSLAVSPDGKKLATASADRSVGLWDLEYYTRHIAGNAHTWTGNQPPAPSQNPGD